MHPYKRTITKCFKTYLDTVIHNDQTMAVSLGLSFMELVDTVAETIGQYFTRNWKIIVSGSLLLPTIHGIIYFFPGAITDLLTLLQQIVFVDIISSLNSVQLHHVIIIFIIFLTTLMFDNKEYKFLIQARIAYSLKIFLLN